CCRSSDSKREPDVGARAAVVADVCGSTVRLGDRLRDREAEPGPVARPRLIDSGEALERMRDELRIEARAVGAHVALDLSIWRARIEAEVVASIPERVVDEVAQRLLEPEPIPADPDVVQLRAPQRLAKLLGPPFEAGRYRGEEVVHIDGLDPEWQLPAIGTSQQEEVLRQRGEALDLIRRPAGGCSKLVPGRGPPHR